MNKVKKIISIEFNWTDIVEQLSESFRLTEKENTSLKESKIAKLIGVLPFLANSDNPERVSLNH